MGIEQILLPILGGIAKGTGEGLEQRRQQRVQLEAQRNVGMAKTFREKPELYEVPEFRNWANKYYGPQEAKAMYSSARIEKLQNQYLTDERVRTGNPNPDPLSPDQMPPEPQFADFSGGGNRGGIAGLISKFLPGAGAVMNALGIGGPGAAQAQTPQPSTGPPSGPQGYAPAGGWQQVGGAQAAQGFTGPGAPPATQMAMDQRIGVPAISQIPITRATPLPGGGAEIVVQGTPPPRGTKSAFTRQRPQKIAKNVTLSINKDGEQSIKMTAFDDNLSSNLNEVARVLIDATRPEGQKLDMTNADDIALVIAQANQLGAAAQATKTGAVNAEQLRNLQNPAFGLAQRNLAANKAGGGAEGTVEVEMRPDVVEFKAEQARRSAAEAQKGKAQGGVEQFFVPPQGGMPGYWTSPNEQESKQIADNARAKFLAEPLDAQQQKQLRSAKRLYTLGEQAQKIYDDNKGKGFINRFWATENSTAWRKYWGTLSPQEQRLHSIISDMNNESIAILSGMGVPLGEVPRLLGPLPNMAVGNPALFKDELLRFRENAQRAVNDQIELARTPLGELQGVGASAPKPLRETPMAPPAAATETPRIPQKSGVKRLPVPETVSTNPQTQPANVKEQVRPNDPNATNAPSQEMVVSESSYNNPQDRAAIKEQIRQLSAQGIKVVVRKVPDKEVERLRKEQEAAAKR